MTHDSRTDDRRTDAEILIEGTPVDDRTVAFNGYDAETGAPITDAWLTFEGPAELTEVTR